jgi:hypothetical protein
LVSNEKQYITYAKQKFEWTDDTIQLIDWEAMRKHMNIENATAQFTHSWLTRRAHPSTKEHFERQAYFHYVNKNLKQMTISYIVKNKGMK